MRDESALDGSRCTRLSNSTTMRSRCWVWRLDAQLHLALKLRPRSASELALVPDEMQTVRRGDRMESIEWNRARALRVKYCHVRRIPPRQAPAKVTKRTDHPCPSPLLDGCGLNLFKSVWGAREQISALSLALTSKASTNLEACRRCLPMPDSLCCTAVNEFCVLSLVHDHI